MIDQSLNIHREAWSGVLFIIYLVLFKVLLHNKYREIFEASSSKHLNIDIDTVGHIYLISSNF